MTRRPKPLPRPLDAAPFRTRTAVRRGVTPRRLRAPDLVSPFAGVRASAPALTVLELAKAYAPLGAEGEFFSHVTAAIIHGLWLPLALELELVLHVSVRKPRRAPRNRGVRGHHLIDRPGLVNVVDGLPVANPFETWAQLARYLDVDDLVVAGEALLAKHRPDRRRNLLRLREIAADPARPYSKRLVAAAAKLRIDSRSAGESRFRLTMVRNGLPEPGINVRIYGDGGRFIGEGDLPYLEQKVLVEYEGDGHRETQQFRKDIGRVEDFQAAGWRVIRATGDDLIDPTRKIALIRRALGM